MLQRGLRDQRTVDLPCPINNILADLASSARYSEGVLAGPLSSQPLASMDQILRFPRLV